MVPLASSSKNLNSSLVSSGVKLSWHSFMHFWNSGSSRVPLPSSSTMRNLRLKPLMPSAPRRLKFIFRRLSNVRVESGMSFDHPMASSSSVRSSFVPYFMSPPVMLPNEDSPRRVLGLAAFFEFGSSPPNEREEPPNFAVAFLLGCGPAAPPEPPALVLFMARRALIWAGSFTSMPKSFSIIWIDSSPVSGSRTSTRLLAVLAHHPSPPGMCHALRIMSSK
mmetsp:Transcript_28547/g.58355  ORF Transcript_28547/g.58355 Transcript_28547/m.58355 type:complete len:221 (-) Transcript_28547:968-1630(-)